MQTISSNKSPFDDVLFHEKDIIITSARLEYNNVIHAMKYVSSVFLEEHHPPRSEARLTLIATLFAVCVLVVYRFTDKVSGTGFVLLLLAVLAGALVAASILYWVPSRFKLDITLINGERIAINSNNERKIHQIHQAITTAVALNRQDPYPNKSYRPIELDEQSNAERRG